MSIEELEQELKEAKAQAYDLRNEYVGFTNRIDEIERKLNELKEKGLENSSVINEEITQEVANEVVAEEPIEETAVEEVQAPENETVTGAPIEENNPVIETSREDNTEPVFETTPAIEESVIDLNNVGLAESVVSSPLIQPEAGIQNEGVSEVQGLDQITSTPSENIVNTGDRKVIIKTDLNAPKAISVNSNQSLKLADSVEEEAKIVFDGQPVDIKTPSEEEKKKELEGLFEELRTTTDEEKSNEITNKIVVLQKEIQPVA